MSNTTNGEKPGKDTPKRKAAGGCNTSTATTCNATLIIATYARIKGATARFMSFFSGIFVFNNVLKVTVVVLVILGALVI